MTDLKPPPLLDILHEINNQLAAGLMSPENLHRHVQAANVLAIRAVAIQTRIEQKERDKENAY